MAATRYGRNPNAAAVLIGRRSRAEGQQFEATIEASCEYYRLRGLAEIEKTPEPTKQLGPKGPDGHFTACYSKKAQPDYKGTLAGGRSVVFEAKHTDKDRLLQSAVTDEQEKRLDRHAALGAECFVLVSFSFRQFFKVPWAVFRRMKDYYGRKYITPADVQEYKVEYMGGVLRFLRGEV